MPTAKIAPRVSVVLTILSNAHALLKYSGAFSARVEKCSSGKTRLNGGVSMEIRLKGSIFREQCDLCRVFMRPFV